VATQPLTQAPLLGHQQTPLPAARLQGAASPHKPGQAPMRFSSREFNQDVGRAKRQALQGPVFITDRGKPAHVLMSMSEYERLSAFEPQPAKPSMAALLAMPADSEWFDWEPGRMHDWGHRPVDLS
jgi:hypothetical protein